MTKVKGVSAASVPFLFLVTFRAIRHYILNETGSRSTCMRPRSDPPKMKNSNVVRSRLIKTQFGVSASNSSRDMARTTSWRKKRKKKKKNNKANWMVRNSAKLDSRTKQHTQSGVSTSDGSRDIAATKSWRKKRKN